jgi:hypothetical protein
LAVGWRNCFAAAGEAEAGKQHMLKLKADADRAAKAHGLSTQEVRRAPHFV